MSKLKINGTEVTATDGETVLQAARRTGAEIPTLCHLAGLPPYSSCMVCVVMERVSGRLIPSCVAPAAEGMDVETDTEEVLRARRDALDLLFGEHVGDCEGPCRLACPARMDIPGMIREIGRGSAGAAGNLVREHIPLPATLGRICPAPCERSCRRGRHDEPVSIKALERYVGDREAGGSAAVPAGQGQVDGARIAVVGAGPMGMASAYYLSLDGHRCTVFDDHARPGGMLRYGVEASRLPEEILDAEIGRIVAGGIELRCGCRVGEQIAAESLVRDFDYVVVATGSIDGPFGKLRVDRRSRQTQFADVFAGGAAAGRGRLAVWAIADGRAVAVSIRQQRRGGTPSGPRSRLNSRIRGLTEAELQEFLRGADSGARVAPSGDGTAGYSASQAAAEAGRCLHCDCRKAGTCSLRALGDSMGADQGRFRGNRHTFEQVRQHAGVIFEPGKCIKCGRCIRVTEQSGEELGLSFIGRGFDLRIGVPFSDSLARALTRTASTCIEVCPTGALAAPGENRP